MVLHTDGALADLEPMPGVYGTIEAEKLREVLRRSPRALAGHRQQRRLGPGPARRGVRRDSWLTLPATAEHVFWPGPADLWDAAVKALDARKLSEFLGLGDVPPDPSVN